MGIFNRSSISAEPDYITLYRDEEDLHPKIAEAFDWYQAFLDRNIQSDYHDHVALAGGALRSFFTSTKVRDYDLYLTKSALDKISNHPNHLVQRSHEWSVTSDTALSWMIKSASYDSLNQDLLMIEANVIKAPKETLPSIIDEFDFTVCMCAISNKTIVYHPDYFTDLTTHVLRVHNPDDPLASLWRAQKYNKLGYTLSRQDLWRLVEGMHEMDSLPTIVKKVDDKAKHPYGSNVKTLEEIFRTS